MEEPSLSAASEERRQGVLFGFFFSAASILHGCRDVGYLLIDRLEKTEETDARGKR
jgi:hypothetical protein